ncbi:MAG: epoxyqueuosine reductase QueH [Alphaproteobacteria bacterium]|nr:epoxyqueuosine reductase QueH [Alphaproteobacteria bacterium]
MKHDLPKLELPTNNKNDKLLIHSCCAPCVAGAMSWLKASGIEFSVFFYNPNIHPQREYELRKEENKKFAEKLGVPFIDADYDTKSWLDATKGMEDMPERSERCETCFSLRLDKTAEYAFENNFKIFTSVLGFSRWKDFDMANRCGHKSANKYEDLQYWEYNWRKKGGQELGKLIYMEEKFYHQKYCGCIHSLKNSLIKGI